MKTELELLECYAEAYKTRRVEALQECLNDIICYATPPDEVFQIMSKTDFLERLRDRFEMQDKVIPIECVEIKIMTVVSPGEHIIRADFGQDRIYISIEARQERIEKIIVSGKNTSEIKLNKAILEWPAKLCYEDSGRILIMPNNNAGKIIDTIIASNYPYETCVVHSFEPKRIVELIKEGFYFMSHLDAPRRLCMATACHHLSQSVLFFDHVHVPRTVKRLLNRYELRINVEFERIVDNCVRKHGSIWMTPFFLETVRAIRAMNRNDVIFTSFGLYRNGELAAGEFGTITGRIYSSYSGYYDENNAGSVQMILTARYLKENGFAFWDLGMPLPYKSTLGAKTINLECFTKLWRRHHLETPAKGMDYAPFPERQNLSDTELLNVFKNAYRYFYIDDLKEYLADDFHYASQYVFSEIKSKAAYLEYLSGKLKTIQRLRAPDNRLFMEIVYDRYSKKPYLFMRQNKTSALFVPQIHDGQFTRIDLCIPELFRFSPRADSAD
jgi:Leu/Phe-tRNA-protein transferase